MIEKLNFAAEGNDIKFLQDYIKYLKVEVPEIFQTQANGWTSLPFIANRLKENTDKGGKNLVIFDADKDFRKRKDELTTKGDELGVEFDLFLFPDNHNAGCFENLIIEIINPKYKAYVNCFDAYCRCVSECEVPALEIPIKSKLYAFLECTGQECKIDKVNFLDSEFWDLEHPKLNALKEFILSKVA